MSAKKLKDTKLGAWLREKAPKVLDKVGDVLPDEGALGIVKNLISADEKDAAYAEAMADAEREAQANVTARWQADMQSDERLAKLVRPLTLIVLLALYLGLAIADSIGGWNFEVKEQYIDLLQILSLTAFGAYFAGRSLEKTKK